MDVKRVVKGQQEFESIYRTACDWWSFWKFSAPPLEFLPCNMICAYNEDGPVAIGFLYGTDSKISWLEFIVANQKSSKIDRSLALDMVLSSAKILSSALGFGSIFTTSKSQTLNKKLGQKYTKTDEGVSHFVGRI